MKFTILLLLLAAASQAAEVKSSSSNSKQKEESKNEKRTLVEPKSAVEKRAPVLPTFIPARTAGIVYANSNELRVNPASKPNIYATPLPQLAKISDVLTGQGPPFQAAITNHLFSPVSVYQSRIPGYEVSAPIPAQLAYTERITYQPQAPRLFSPQGFVQNQQPNIRLTFQPAEYQKLPKPIELQQFKRVETRPSALKKFQRIEARPIELKQIQRVEAQPVKLKQIQQVEAQPVELKQLQRVEARPQQNQLPQTQLQQIQQNQPPQTQLQQIQQNLHQQSQFQRIQQNQPFQQIQQNQPQQYQPLQYQAQTQPQFLQLLPSQSPFPVNQPFQYQNPIQYAPVVAQRYFQQPLAQPGIVYAKEEDKQKPIQRELKTVQVAQQNQPQRNQQNFNTQNQGAVSYASFSVGPTTPLLLQPKQPLPQPQYQSQSQPPQLQYQPQPQAPQLQYQPQIQPGIPQYHVQTPTQLIQYQVPPQEYPQQQFQFTPPQLQPQQYQVQETQPKPPQSQNQAHEYQIQRQPIVQIKEQNEQYHQEVKPQSQVFQKLEKSSANSINNPAKPAQQSSPLPAPYYQPQSVVYQTQPPQIFPGPQHLYPNQVDQSVAVPTLPLVQYFGKYAHELFRDNQQQ